MSISTGSCRSWRAGKASAVAATVTTRGSLGIRDALPPQVYVAAEAGRDRDAVRVAAVLSLSVADDVDGAPAHAIEQFPKYAR